MPIEVNSAQFGESQPGFKQWAVLEIMGRKVVAGFVEEVTIAGAGLLQVTIPPKEQGGDPKTQYYHPSALYCLTPCTEEVARIVAARNMTQPEWAWNLPKVTVAPAALRSPIEVDREAYFRDEDAPPLRRATMRPLTEEEAEYQFEPEIHEYEDDD